MPPFRYTAGPRRRLKKRGKNSESNPQFTRPSSQSLVRARPPYRGPPPYYRSKAKGMGRSVVEVYSYWALDARGHWVQDENLRLVVKEDFPWKFLDDISPPARIYELKDEGPDTYENFLAGEIVLHKAQKAWIPPSISDFQPPPPPEKIRSRKDNFKEKEVSHKPKPPLPSKKCSRKEKEESYNQNKESKGSHSNQKIKNFANIATHPDVLRPDTKTNDQSYNLNNEVHSQQQSQWDLSWMKDDFNVQWKLNGTLPPPRQHKPLDDRKSSRPHAQQFIREYFRMDEYLDAQRKTTGNAQKVEWDYSWMDQTQNTNESERLGNVSFLTHSQQSNDPWAPETKSSKENKFLNGCNGRRLISTSTQSYAQQSNDPWEPEPSYSRNRSNNYKNERNAGTSSRNYLQAHQAEPNHSKDKRKKDSNDDIPLLSYPWESKPSNYMKDKHSNERTCGFSSIAQQTIGYLNDQRATVGTTSRNYSQAHQQELSHLSDKRNKNSNNLRDEIPSDLYAQKSDGRKNEYFKRNERTKLEFTHAYPERQRPRSSHSKMNTHMIDLTSESKSRFKRLSVGEKSPRLEKVIFHINEKCDSSPKIINETLNFSDDCFEKFEQFNNDVTIKNQSVQEKQLSVDESIEHDNSIEYKIVFEEVFDESQTVSNNEEKIESHKENDQNEAAASLKWDDEIDLENLKIETYEDALQYANLCLKFEISNFEIEFVNISFDFSNLNLESSNVGEMPDLLWSFSEDDDDVSIKNILQDEIHKINMPAEKTPNACEDTNVQHSNSNHENNGIDNDKNKVQLNITFNSVRIDWNNNNNELEDILNSSQIDESKVVLDVLNSTPIKENEVEFKVFIDTLEDEYSNLSTEHESSSYFENNMQFNFAKSMLNKMQQEWHDDNYWLKLISYDQFEVDINYFEKPLKNNEIEIKHRNQETADQSASFNFLVFISPENSFDNLEFDDDEYLELPSRLQLESTAADDDDDYNEQDLIEKPKTPEKSGQFEEREVELMQANLESKDKSFQSQMKAFLHEIQNQITSNVSMVEDEPKLHTCKNPWVPLSILNAEALKDEEEPKIHKSANPWIPPSILKAQASLKTSNIEPPIIPNSKAKLNSSEKFQNCFEFDPTIACERGYTYEKTYVQILADEFRRRLKDWNDDSLIYLRSTIKSEEHRKIIVAILFEEARNHPENVRSYAQIAKSIVTYFQEKSVSERHHNYFFKLFCARARQDNCYTLLTLHLPSDVSCWRYMIGEAREALCKCETEEELDRVESQVDQFETNIRRAAEYTYYPYKQIYNGDKNHDNLRKALWAQEDELKKILKAYRPIGIAIVNFIGELFLQDLITSRIMTICLMSIYKWDGITFEADEYNMLRLIGLLRVVGHKVEAKEYYVLFKHYKYFQLILNPPMHVGPFLLKEDLSDRLRAEITDFIRVKFDEKIYKLGAEPMKIFEVEEAWEKKEDRRNPMFRIILNSLDCTPVDWSLPSVHIKTPEPYNSQMFKDMYRYNPERSPESPKRQKSKKIKTKSKRSNESGEWILVANKKRRRVIT